MFGGWVLSAVRAPRLVDELVTLGTRVALTADPALWVEALLDLLTVLRRLVELEPQQADLLDRIVAGSQIAVEDLTPLVVPGVGRSAQTTS
ncbi:hypothetical protein BDK92_3672 [Micromonospora pisi]|uniref:Uncharacterized protein n=1 Tax=Micromonospora pisi TaxID=589240 RepID=A0A495JL93_9ACTN|nr:hypothetical protein [Micromonospora pisi]RKR89328.1 hypothetical protein BDK92_3672 [Micromonospora pisi]